MAASRPWPPGPTHARLILQEAQRLTDLHDTFLEVIGIVGVVWFVVDLRSLHGRSCAEDIVGHSVAEHRLRSATTRGIAPSMPFPLDGDGALVILQQLAPMLIDPVQRRLSGEVPIVVLDQEDQPALCWLSEIRGIWGRA